jgi:hypothetical protein
MRKMMRQLFFTALVMALLLAYTVTVYAGIFVTDGT